MTIQEYESRRSDPCKKCGGPVKAERNPNNNALQVVCANSICASRSPWGLTINLKQTTKKNRKPLPDGETLDSVWEKWGDFCFICGAPKSALIVLGIGRQVHHALPHAIAGHQGPLLPICTNCHPVVSDRQRIYWFIQRLISNHGQSVPGGRADVSADGVPPDSVRTEGEAPLGGVEGLSDDDADD